MTTSPLAEYIAVREKIDAAVDAIAIRRHADIACRAGCASCCVDGLSVLAVEASAIAAFLVEHHPPQTLQPHHGEQRCAFLDDGDQCAIYAVRPLLCRTHGMALRGAPRSPASSSSTTPSRALTVLNDVAHCDLNYKARAPNPVDVIDATTIQALLTTVDARFRARESVDDARTSLGNLARRWITSTHP